MDAFPPPNPEEGLNFSPRTSRIKGRIRGGAGAGRGDVPHTLNVYPSGVSGGQSGRWRANPEDHQAWKKLEEYKKLGYGDPSKGELSKGASKSTPKSYDSDPTPPMGIKRPKL